MSGGPGAGQREVRSSRRWQRTWCNSLAPQFAITAHVAQGQTIKEGVMTDLCIGPMGNPFTVYVAITRVQGRGKLLIFRPFDAAPFQKGIGLGRDLLLRHLRGDAINWQALLAKYCEERVCSTCAERKQSTAFTPGQWKRSDTDRVCRECTKHYADAGTPWQCNVCKLWHVEANFPEKHRQRQCSFFRVCLTCEMKKPCFKCGVAKPEAEFGPAAWKARNADRRCCRECTTKQRGCWQCSQCSERKPRAEFTAWQQSRKHTQDGTQVCNACTAFAFVCRLAHRTNQRLARLRQRESRQRHEAILAQTFARRFRKSTRLGKRRWEQTKPERVLPIHRPSSLLWSPTQRRRGCTHTSARIAPNLCKALWQQGKFITAAVMAAAKNFALRMACLQAVHLRTHVQHAAQ